MFQSIVHLHQLQVKRTGRGINCQKKRIHITNLSVLKQAPSQPLQKMTLPVRKVKLHRLRRERTHKSRHNLLENPHQLPPQRTLRSLVLLTPNILKPLWAQRLERNGSSSPVLHPPLYTLPHFPHQHSASSPCSSKANCLQKRKVLQSPSTLSPRRNLSNKVIPVPPQTQVRRCGN